ncbi:uncharacterized protein [Montipora capricornis]|uniref:uncharacterized protein n=1 Tax=Montipora capricornis TaxID=246305 RepID=UPI0035F1300F
MAQSRFCLVRGVCGHILYRIRSDVYSHHGLTCRFSACLVFELLRFLEVLSLFHLLYFLDLLRCLGCLGCSSSLGRGCLSIPRSYADWNFQEIAITSGVISIWLKETEMTEEKITTVHEKDHPVPLVTCVMIMCYVVASMAEVNSMYQALQTVVQFLH